MAKSFEQQLERATAQGWKDLSFPVCAPDLTNDVSATLQKVILEVVAGGLDFASANSGAELLDKARQEAISSSEPVSESNKLFLVQAGELAMLLRYYGENYNCDESLSDSRNLSNIRRLAEDCLLLSK
jgi:hypothetical protein